MTESTQPNWVTGNLDDVKEQRMVYPATQNVIVKIEELKMENEKEGAERNWKWITGKVKVVDGIEVAGETKFKGNEIRLGMICYNANHEFYVNKDTANNKLSSEHAYSKKIYNGQHLIDVRNLAKAVGVTGLKIESINGLTDLQAAQICEEGKGKTISFNILQRTNDGIVENEYVGFKPVESSSLV